MTALSEARARLAELEAERTNLAAQVKDAADRLAPIEAKRTANTKRRDRVPVVMLLAGSVTRGTLASIHAERWSLSSGQLVDKTPKQVAEAIASGAIKISAGNGITYTARGLATRTVRPQAADMRAWDKAIAARRRIEKKLAEARGVEDTAAKAAYDHGTKVPVDQLVRDVVTATMLDLAADAARDRSGAASRLNQLTDGQYGPLTLAKRHVDHLVKKVDHDTGCPICQREQREAKERDERIARIKTLARRKINCPDHGRVLGYVERSNRVEWVKDEDGREQQVRDLPVAYCPRDWRRYIDGKQFAADKAKAAKAAEAEAKKKVRVVTFVCPNPECEWEGESDVIDDTVTCDNCDVEYDVNRVRITKKAA